MGQRRKLLNLPRAPLLRQKGGAHRPDKGRGSYDRRQERIRLQKQDKED